jgi:hypothetical protein
MRKSVQYVKDNKEQNLQPRAYLPGTKEGLHETYLIFEDNGLE